MKGLFHEKLAALVLSGVLFITSVQAQNNFFACDGSALSAAKWGPSAVGPFTSTFTANSVATFSVAAPGTGTGGSITVGGLTATENFTITSPSGTISNASNGVIIIDVSGGKTLDFGSQAFTTSATAGYIKNNSGTVALAGSTYSGGFTLNNGTVVTRGINAMGANNSNTLTINGGTIAANANRDFSGKYPGGITIGGDFTLGSSTSPAASSANLTFSNAVSLGTGTTRTINIGATGVYSFTGAISGVGSNIIVTSSSTGDLGLSGACTYSGTTTLNSGDLQFSRTGGNTLPATNDVIVNGGALQVSTNQTLNNLTLNSGGTISIDADVTVTINGTLHMNGGVLNLLTNAKIVYGPNGTLRYGASTPQTVTVKEFPSASGPKNLIIDNAAGVSLPAAFPRSITGDLTLMAGTFNDGGNVFITSGHIFGSGSHAGTGQISMNGPSKTISGATFQNLSINDTGISLAGSATINGTLSLGLGSLIINTFTLTAATITGFNSSKFIITNSTGKLKRICPASPVVTVFPVGSSAVSYDPVTIQPTNSVPFAINVKETTVAGDFPGTIEDYGNVVHRLWDIAPDGTPGNTILSLTNGAANYTPITPVIGHYDGGLWQEFSATYSANQWTGTTSLFSPFGAGNDNAFNDPCIPPPTVSCPVYSPVCLDTDPFLLTGGVPGGGTYTGPGVSANTFSPVIAGVGNHLVTYTITDGNGCTNSCTFSVVVHDLPMLACPPNLTVDIIDLPLDLTTLTYSPTGGTFSGTGVTGNNFNPGMLGMYTVTYSYTDMNGCSNTCQFILTVESACVAEAGTVSGSTSFCGSGATTLMAAGYATGNGETYEWESSTDNFLMNIVGTGDTNPAFHMTGTITSTMYYRLRVTCTATMMTDYSNIVTVTVNPVPSCSITGPTMLCPVMVPFDYFGPEGMSMYDWTISGAGIIIDASNQQMVTAQDLAMCNTSFTLTLTVTDMNGCTSSCTHTVVLNDTQNPTFPDCPTTPISLGCNPMIWPTADDAIAASGEPADNCVVSSVTATPGSITGTCDKTQTWTVAAVDICGNMGICFVTYSWKEDTSAPQFTDCPTSPVDLGCNPGITPVPVNWMKSIPANLPDYGVNGGLERTGAPGWTVGAEAAPVSGDFELVYTIESIVQGQFLGDIMCGYGKIDPNPFTILALGNNDDGRLLYAGEGWDIHPYPPVASPWEDYPATTAMPGDIYTLTITRVGGLISYAIEGATGGDEFGVIENANAGIIYPAVTLFNNGSRLVSAVLTTNNDPDAISEAQAIAGAGAVMDNCGVEVISGIGGTITGGCAKMQTWTITASDSCGNTASCEVTYTWTSDTIPPQFMDCPASLIDLGCNPVDANMDNIPDAVLQVLSWSDNCDGMGTTGNYLDIASVLTGCNRSLARQFSYTDMCGNTNMCTVSYTWNVDTADPQFTDCPANPVDLGCNPGIIQIPISWVKSIPANLPDYGVNGGLERTGAPGWDVGAEASAVSGDFELVYTIESIVQGQFLGDIMCGYGKINPNPFTILALGNNDDGRLLYAGEGWDIHPYPPVASPWEDYPATTAMPGDIYTFTITRVGGLISYAIEGATGGDEFGVIENANAGIIYPAVTLFNNGSRLVSAVLTTNNDPDAISEAQAIAGAGTVMDDCGVAVLSGMGGTITGACTKTQTWTITATDSCGNTASCEVTYTWASDTIPPQFVDCPASLIDLGCNPIDANMDNIPDAVLQVLSWTDNCDGMGTTGNYLDIASVLNGCNRSLTRQFSYTDMCGNTGMCAVSYTWKVDLVTPVFDVCPMAPLDLGCNPPAITEMQAISDAGSVTDDCMLVDFIASGGAITGSCIKIQIWTVTVTDACGNSATCLVTYTWTSDLEDPQFANCPASSIGLGCNPPAVTEAQAIMAAGSATDNCMITSVTATGGMISGTCSQSQTWTVTAVDACGNQGTCTVNFTWTSDLTDPVFSNCPVDPVDLGLDPAPVTPTQAIMDAGTVTDNCMVTMVTATSDPITGQCTKTQTWTVTAVDACGNDATCQVVYTWMLTPPVVTCPNDQSICIDEDLFALTGGTPVGGIYSGPGVTMNSFDPVAAGPGMHTITYTYTDGNNCSNACTFVITVNSLPVVNCPANFSVCNNDPAFALSGATPVGGTYSGNGVAMNTFDPAAAGAGMHTISYTYTDGNNCTNSCQFVITVNAAPVVTCPMNYSVCIDAVPFGLTGGAPMGGTYSGTGVTMNTFDPAAAGAGMHTITYTYTDGNNCSSSCTFVITVNNLPVVICPANFSVCSDDPAFALSGATPVGGTYSGTGVTMNTFDPASAGAGMHTITYTYTDGNNCTNTCEFIITVTTPPVVTCPMNYSVCIDAIPFALTGGNPMGGNYSGTGVSLNTFNPASAGTGMHTITYSYTDGNNCTGSCTFVITVNPLPMVSCPMNFGVCIDEDPFALSGGSPDGGTYSGAGVTMNTFDPSMAGAGMHTITYTVQDGNGCTNTCTFVVTVTASVILDCPEDFSVCSDATPFMLTGATPAGGTYSGDGVAMGVFDPALAGPGMHTITYTFVQGQCQGSCSFVITVNTLPVVTCPMSFNVCDNITPFALTGGTPLGGTYSGSGVSMNTFNPATAGPGMHTITYTYTDGNNCSNSCQFIITVNAAPVVTCPMNFSVCIDAPSFALTGGSPAGGTYSGTGVSMNTFDPASAGAGMHTITYTYTAINGCPASCTFIITVNPLPVMFCPASYALCIEADPVTLSGATPVGGTYSGAGVSMGVFDPASAGLGMHTITYSYTDGNGCSNTCSFVITVTTAITINCIPGASVCLTEAPFMIPAGTPAGGTYSGDGVSGNMFNPAAAGLGPHLITYTYILAGCTYTCSFTYTVTNCPLPATFEWIPLDPCNPNGTCLDESNCCDNVICFGLRYTPGYSGMLTSYTTGFITDCNGGPNPVITNQSCVMNDNSFEIDACADFDLVLFNSSGNTGTLPITASVPVMLHKVCLQIMPGDTNDLIEDIITDLTASITLTGGGLVDEFPSFDTTTVFRTAPVVPANGTGIVSCASAAVPPALPLVLDQCCDPVTGMLVGVVDNPMPLSCEGTRTYTYAFTDCGGASSTWQYVYTIEYEDFVLPPNDGLTVNCPDATDMEPELPLVYDNCNVLLTPSAPVISAKPMCDGTRTYDYTYTDCVGNSHVWTFTYTVMHTAFPNPGDVTVTVDCPVNTNTPPATLPTVTDNCGVILTPSMPVISDPLTCEGTRTYTYTYTDCAGNTQDWVFTYNVVLPPFPDPLDAGTTVDCPNDTDTPPAAGSFPVVIDQCGNLVLPSLPVVSAKPGCEGTRTYTYTYTDCGGNTQDWVYTYTVEYEPFSITIPNGESTVQCTYQTDTPPSWPLIVDNCGVILPPADVTIATAPACEGTRTYTYLVADCEGNTDTWVFTYTVDVPLPVVPAPGGSTVECPDDSDVIPTPPNVPDVCFGGFILPSGPVVSLKPACEGLRTYTWTYTNCAGESVDWTYTYNVDRTISPHEVGEAESSAEIACYLDAAAPTLPEVRDECDNLLSPTGPVIGGTNTGGCSGTITYTYTYTDCANLQKVWTYTYYVSCQSVQLKVWLEGCYSLPGDSMRTTLNQTHVLPGQTPPPFYVVTPPGQPYQGTPWNYTGNLGNTYGDGMGLTPYPPDVVDWVLVIVRKNGILPAQNIWTCAGWVHKDGTVTFPDNCPVPAFNVVDNYYYVVQHRNHLGILSPAEVDMPCGTAVLEWDFRNSNSYQPLFRFGQKQVEPNVWAMFAANCEQVSSIQSINSLDRTNWKTQQGIFGYKTGDLDLNAATNSIDETLWKLNQNKTTGVVFY